MLPGCSSRAFLVAVAMSVGACGADEEPRDCDLSQPFSRIGLVFWSGSRPEVAPETHSPQPVWGPGLIQLELIAADFRVVASSDGELMVFDSEGAAMEADGLWTHVANFSQEAILLERSTYLADVEMPATLRVRLSRRDEVLLDSKIEPVYRGGEFAEPGCGYWSSAELVFDHLVDDAKD